jgi:hypothetical protein
MRAVLLPCSRAEVASSSETRGWGFDWFLVRGDCGKSSNQSTENENTAHELDQVFGRHVFFADSEI